MQVVAIKVESGIEMYDYSMCLSPVRPLQRTEGGLCKSAILTCSNPSIIVSGFGGRYYTPAYLPLVSRI